MEWKWRAPANRGFAFTADVNLDGATTVTNSSAQTTITPPSSTPEPSSVAEMATALLAIGLWLVFRLRQQRTRAGRDLGLDTSTSPQDAGNQAGAALSLRNSHSGEPEWGFRWKKYWLL